MFTDSPKKGTVYRYCGIELTKSCRSNIEGTSAGLAFNLMNCSSNPDIFFSVFHCVYALFRLC